MLANGLHQQIDDLQQRMNRVGDAVYATFFAMKPTESEIAAEEHRVAATPTPAPVAQSQSQSQSQTQTQSQTPTQTPTDA